MNSEICTKLFYVYNEILVGTDIVKKYLREHKHILVGGQSIDYAIRLKGSKLYEDWEIPDLDFVTDNHANVAYSIFKEVSVLSNRVNISVLGAMHPTTMRVQVAKFAVADVTFIPTRILEIYQSSALEYDGCLIRHPFFQYVDIQRSFSFPYENTMMEVITHRWEKDFKRLLLTMKYYSPHDDYLVKTFASKYSIRKTPNLSKLGYKKNRLYKMSKEIGKDTIQAEDIIKMYKTLNLSSPKKISTLGIVNGELAYLIYMSIYKMIFNKKFDKVFITGDESNMSYTGSDNFLNSYVMTDDDKEHFSALNPKLESRDTHPYIDIIPSRMIAGEWELVGVEHRMAYHSINLKKLNSSYPNVTLRVVSINYLILYISMLWITLRANIYLSMFIKLLKIIEKVYNLQDEPSPLIQWIYPSIETYGIEMKNLFEKNKLTVKKPPNIYINKYTTVEKAINSIQPFEYQEIYNLDGM